MDKGEIFDILKAIWEKSSIQLIYERGKDAAHETRAGPFGLPTVAGEIGGVAGWQITPGGAGPAHPEDGIQDEAVGAGRAAAVGPVGRGGMGGQEASALAIPPAAIAPSKNGQEKAVFVVDACKAKRVPIKTGIDDGLWVEVVDGLTCEEEVVVVGKSGLTDGQAVQSSGYDLPNGKAAKQKM